VVKCSAGILSCHVNQNVRIPIYSFGNLYDEDDGHD
jgi:hypothetical protein